MVHKNKLKKISDYGIILPTMVPSHISGIIQKYDIMFGEAETGVPLSVLNFSYKLYVRKHVPHIVPHNIPHLDKSDLAYGEKFLDVPLMYRPLRNQPLIQKNIANETQETNMGNQDVDKDVSDIFSDMLETDSHIYMENGDVTPENNYVNDDDHVQEVVEEDINDN